ncbi:cytochrome P450 [Macrolepiota fuliginosa MF-IS2]|uniref:Cytochrome P450 n=1 Tax=Macrolepiota fuliginosa MF-IS2 TaxID=1400762 RepID=A0A9P5X364_9AGAR|nr:cytochrome P450 [Macrolepiota fuliginosa MF-IS2]
MPQMLVQQRLSVPQILSAAVAAWVVQILLRKWIKAKRIARRITPCPPGALTLLNPFRTISLIVGPFYPFKDQIACFFARFSLYKRYGSTCLVSTTFWGAMPTYWLADADSVKAVASDRFTFTKDVEAYETLNIYGHNMVGLEGSEWKRHRAIAKTAFNEANNAFVWRETTRIVNEWFSEIDAATTFTVDGPTVEIDLLRDLTRATLLVIGSAGFGRRSTWLEDVNSTPPPGHKVPFSLAVAEAIGQLFPRILAPKPIWNAVTEKDVHVPLIGPILLKAKDAFENLRRHMLEVVSQARDQYGINQHKAVEDESGGAALLKNMVEANMTFEKREGEVGHRSMTDGELFSNMFVFLLAGHETSAHTLCFSFVYLALYPEYQRRVFEEALKVYPDGVPTAASASAYKDILPQLEYTWAVLHETLRLCPPVVRLGKLVQNDTVIKAKRFTTSPEGKVRVTQEIDVPVQKGGMCVMDILGMHMNPIHWGDDVDSFKPDRFIDTETYKWPRDAFLAFSGGPRSCIGQRFAITESVCIIASIVRRYEILLPEDVIGLDFEEQKRRLTRWRPGITIIPTNARVRFRRRED